MATTKSSQRKEKMADTALGSLSTRHIFRGIEYVISMFLRGEVVIVEAEDRLTADQWRGEFDARCKLIVERFTSIIMILLYYYISILVTCFSILVVCIRITPLIMFF